LEPSNEQYLIINALQTLELINYDWYESERGVWFIATPSGTLATAVILRNGDIYPINWVQDYDKN
jgi:hypothetical protein